MLKVAQVAVTDDPCLSQISLQSGIGSWRTWQGIGGLSGIQKERLEVSQVEDTIRIQHLLLKSKKKSFVLPCT